jgi:hypothetical protein
MLLLNSGAQTFIKENLNHQLNLFFQQRGENLASQQNLNLL